MRIKVGDTIRLIGTSSRVMQILLDDDGVGKNWNGLCTFKGVNRKNKNICKVETRGVEAIMMCEDINIK